VHGGPTYLGRRMAAKSRKMLLFDVPESVNQGTGKFNLEVLFLRTRKLNDAGFFLQERMAFQTDCLTSPTTAGTCRVYVKICVFIQFKNVMSIL
jgi:hypothetical protein